MALRIIFLDFDGVLNSTRWLYSLAPGPGWPTEHIDPAAVAVLREIASRTGAKIVVSSTWRKMHTQEELTAYLRKHSCDAEVIGMTPDLFRWRDECDRGFRELHKRAPVRGDEIQMWLDQWSGDPVEAFVILDDDADMGGLADRLIRTTGEDGLLWAHVEPVVAQLTRAWDR